MHDAPLSAIDLNLLVALEALLDERHVGRAARRLHRSQPAMSRTLSRLRELFADELLVKEGRGMVATGRADALREPLKRLLSDTRDVLRPPAPFEARTSTRHFRFVSSDYAHVVLTGSIIESLREAAVGITLSVLPVGAGAIEALATGAADLLFGPPALCPPWCEQEPILADDWACVGRRGARFPRGLAGYLRRDHVAVGTDQVFGDPIALALRAMSAERRVRLRVSDFAGALFVAATSDLLATVPRPVAVAGAALLPLAVGPVPFTAEAPVVAMIWPRRSSSDPAHAWLRETVRTLVRARGKRRGSDSAASRREPR